MTCYPRPILKQTKAFTIHPITPLCCFNCGTRIHRAHQGRHAMCKHCISKIHGFMYGEILHSIDVSKLIEGEVSKFRLWKQTITIEE